MISVTSASYAIAAAAFLLLGVLLLTSWRGRAHGRMLSWAALITAAASALRCWEAASGSPLSVLADSVEIVRSGAWSAFLIVLLGHFFSPGSRLPFRLRPSLFLIAAAYLLLLGFTMFG
ncbi:MAG: PEP-CTERM system histidine kinase PrsK, partial [Pseudomonadota bacterium]|nr:PEP-CTERM system histidine kinase PrsK [Pseudomonadota bacterium]